MDTMNDRLQTVQAQLAELVGGDLADSLVRAGRSGTEMSLNLQLLINDGVEQLSDDQKRQVLELIDGMLPRKPMV